RRPPTTAPRWRRDRTTDDCARQHPAPAFSCLRPEAPPAPPGRPRPAQGAGDLWSAELRSSFPADRQRLSQHFGGFRASAGVKENASLHFESLRLEPPRAELPGKLHGSFQVVPHRVKVAKLIAGEGAHRFAEQFGAWLSHKRSGTSSGVAVFFCLQRLIEI